MSICVVTLTVAVYLYICCVCQSICGNELFFNLHFEFTSHHQVSPTSIKQLPKLYNFHWSAIKTLSPVILTPFCPEADELKLRSSQPLHKASNLFMLLTFKTGLLLPLHVAWWNDVFNYRKISNIRRTKYQNLNVSRLGLKLSLCNILKPRVKWRRNM